MRSTLILSALTALALAAPRPQEIEFDEVDAAPDPEIFTPPTNVTVDVVPDQPVASVVAIGTAVVTDVASTTDPAQKRDMIDAIERLARRDAYCAPQPSGSGPISNPDTAPNFLADPQYQNIAAAAPVPQGYTLAFSQLQASSQTTAYRGFKNLDTYDTIACQEYCDQDDQCTAFNIYFERDPTVNPGPDCSDPPSTTNIKCVRYGVLIQPETAINDGETRRPGTFVVRISGSNGYNKNAPPPSQAGFSGPMELGGAINAPLDPVTNTNTYMGYKFWSLGTGSGQVQTYDLGAKACTAACTAQTAYNSRHPPKTGQPNVCNQVVVYVLSDENVPQGVYCAMYTESWAQNYATNYGQYRGSDYWSVSQAYSYTNATYSAQYENICAVGGCPSKPPSYRGGNCGGYGQSTTGTC